MTDPTKGTELLEELKAHLLETMRGLPECAPAGEGLSNKELEDEAGLDLGRADQKRWVTWSLVKALLAEGRIEQTGSERRPKYRLTAAETRARLFRTILPTTDIEATVAFYAAVLGEAGERVSEARHYFDCGQILAIVDPIADLHPDAPVPHPNSEHVYFAVDDLEAYHARAREAGAAELGEIATRPWGERSFYCRDPFGNPICFVDAARTYTGGDWRAQRA